MYNENKINFILWINVFSMRSLNEIKWPPCYVYILSICDKEQEQKCRKLGYALFTT